MKPEEKISLLEKEYGPIDKEMEREVKGMCNLSDMIEERGIEKGRAEGIKRGIEKGKTEIILSMLREGISEEQILKIANLTKEELDELRCLLEQIQQQEEN